MRRAALAVSAAALCACFFVPLAAAQPTSTRPVPSLQPRATQQLWSRLVHHRRVAGPAATLGCRPLRAVFYTSTDWLRLATKLAANASPCAQYYISIPPLAADKTKFRYDQPWRIRALGPQFHVLAEINYNGWTNWVTANNSTYYEAGLEARRRMAAQGFDVASGDSWIVNEFSSAVRNGTNVARQKVRDLVRGLYEGDGTVPTVKGGVFDIGIGQSTGDLSTYKLALQNWYLDASFWQDMSAYVSDWSQELYGDVRDYGVAGASASDRAAHLNEYLQHQLSLADTAPSEASVARSFIDGAYSPLANAAWIYDSGFGFTNVPLDQMQDYVSGQVYALRSFDAAHGFAQDHFGFAWAPQMAGNVAWTSDFTTQTGQLLDRLSAALRDSGTSPDAACTGWCTAAVSGASFVETWKTFTSWSYPALGFTSAQQTLTAGAASAPITVQLQQAGVAQTGPATISIASSSAAGGFSTSADGPWTPTLSLDVPAGSPAATVYYRDTTAGTATLTASAAGRQTVTQTETVVPGAPASLSVSPTPATVALGSSRVFTVSGADAYGNAVAPAASWTASSGTLSSASGASTSFTPSASGTATITATANGLSATATVTTPAAAVKTHVSSITYTRTNSTLYVTITVVDSSGRPVSGAPVSLSIYRNNALYATGTIPTGANGTVTGGVGAPTGCYRTTITGVSASGTTWDGTTPSNGRCF